MTCAEVERFLQGLGDSLPSDVAEHLSTCRRCQSRFTDMVTDVEIISSKLEQRIGATLAHSLEPVSPLPPRSTLILQTSAVFVLLPVLIIAWIGADGLRATTWVQFAGMMAVIAAAEIQLSLSLCALMVPGCRLRPTPKAVLLAVVPVYAVATLLLYPLVSAGGESKPFVKAGLRCMQFAVAVAISAAIALWLLARRGAVLSWGTTAATIGLLAALTGLSVLQFDCTTVELLHVLTWHGGSLLICMLAGLALGKFFARRT
jgi:hypothetical protein